MAALSGILTIRDLDVLLKHARGPESLRVPDITAISTVSLRSFMNASGLRPWRRVSAERLQRCRVFDLDRVRYAPPDGGSASDFFVVDAPDWINIIALTGDRQVVLVRQFRFGTAELSLEIPGGMCDAGEEPLAAARRELLEETGYASDDWVELGWVHPNPAVQVNRCHHFLARNARRTAEPTPDEHEAFEVETVPLDDIAAMIRDGRITHALVVSAFYRLGTV